MISKHDATAAIPVAPYVEAIPVARALVPFDTEAIFSVDPTFTHRVTVIAHVGPTWALVRRFNVAQIDSTLHEAPGTTLVTESAPGASTIRVAPIVGPFTGQGESATVVIEELHTRHSLPLMVESATLVLDETWSPYAQLTLVCKTPPEDVLAQIDPRAGQRVRALLRQRFGEGQPLSALSAAGHATLADWSAAYAGQMLSAVSADFGRGYNPGVGMRASTRRRVDLALVSREVSEVDGTMTIVAMSDEVAAQGAGLVASSPITPGGTSLLGAIGLALSRLNTGLFEWVDDVTDLDPDSLAWVPGVSAWDYMANLALSSERRLWCDDRRTWRLGYPAAAGSDALHVTPIRTESVDTLTTEGWYDGVVVEWRWTDGAGVDHVIYENAGPADARAVFRETREGRPFPRSGAARTTLRWLSSNGRNVRIEAVCDYRAQPGQVVNVTLPDGAYASGVVQSVTFNLPADRMTVVTRDLLEAPANSWLADTAGVAWDALPVGTDWTEDL